MSKYYREYAFYVPELDTIVIHFSFYNIAAFGWDYSDYLKKTQVFDFLDPFENYTLIRLGEV